MNRGRKTTWIKKSKQLETKNISYKSQKSYCSNIFRINFSIGRISIDDGSARLSVYNCNVTTKDEKNEKPIHKIKNVSVRSSSTASAIKTSRF
jgi:hypothetical protein